MFKKFIFILSLFAFSVPAYGKENSRKLIIFHSPACHRCIEAKNNLIPRIEEEFKNKITIEYSDVANIENYKSLLGLREKYNANISLDLPLYFFEGNFITYHEPLKERLKEFLLKPSPYIQQVRPAEIDLIAHFKTLKPLMIISLGLSDGINPCAFTVIVFFVSFLALQGYRKRELIIIGLAFIFSVFLTYILIGIGLFGALYRLKAFQAVSRGINLSVGLFSIILGICALYDFFKFKKTKSTAGLILQLPQSIKNRIHSLIGAHYRDTEIKESGKPKRNILKLTVSAFVTGFLISSLEAICTGQLYLPTITFVLKTTHLKMQALGYLLLYNFMFIMPLLAIFLFALFGISSAQFSKILKSNLLFVKLIMAVLFFGLGIYLVGMP